MSGIMKYLKSLRGKITITLLLFTIAFIITSSYVYFKNSQIFKQHNDIIKHGERNVREVFVFHWALNQSLTIIYESAARMDTSGRSRFYNTLTSVHNTMGEMQAHCDSLGLPGFRYTKQRNDSLYQNYINDAEHVFSLIKKYKYTNDSIPPEVYQAEINDFITNKTSHDYWAFDGTTWEILNQVNPLRELKIAELEADTKEIRVVLITITGISLITFAFIGLKLSRLISVFLQKITNQLKRIANGELVTEQVTTKDEMGEILTANNVMVSNLEKASEFATAVGRGDFKHQFTPISSSDKLGLALISMRDDLQKFKKDDERRLWVNEGYNNFGEILRQYNNNLQELSDRSISFLVKYLNANQGSLYVLSDSGNNTDDSLELIGCYAYNRKKHISKKIDTHEGLVGQAFQEKSYIYLTEVPKDYIKITSGLGQATPTTLLIMPLVAEDKALGVIEIAAFQKIEAFKIEFLQKVGQDMASVLLTVQNAERTQNLLTQLQASSEQMSGQEEELRQNMEELMATQEEMKRKEREYLQTIETLEKEVKKFRTQKLSNV